MTRYICDRRRAQAWLGMAAFVSLVFLVLRVLSVAILHEKQPALRMVSEAWLPRARKAALMHTLKNLLSTLWTEPRGQQARPSLTVLFRSFAQKSSAK